MRTFRTASCKITGYRKKNEGKPCEDAIKVLKSGAFTVMAAADGHGDSRCLLADVGSAIAVKSACEALSEYGRHLGKTDPSNYWNSIRNEVAMATVKKFARMCLGDYEGRFDTLSRDEAGELLWYIDSFGEKSPSGLTPTQAREKYAKSKLLQGKLEKILYLYGTTLRASIVGKGYVFSMAIGDGDTVMLTSRGIRWIIPKSPAYETGTYSMCDDFSVIMSEFLFSYIELDNNDAAGVSRNSYNMKLIMLSTDGFRNSFMADEDFCNKIEEIHQLICTRGIQKLSRPLKRLFCRLTRESLYQDDISAVIGAFFDS